MPTEDDRLSAVVNVRLTAAEKAGLKEAADLAGLSVSEYVRRRALSDARLVRPFPGEQAQRAQQNTLARPGFSRDGGKARLEVEGDFLKQGQVPDSERLQHGCYDTHGVRPAGVKAASSQTRGREGTLVEDHAGLNKSRRHIRRHGFVSVETATKP